MNEERWNRLGVSLARLEEYVLIGTEDFHEIMQRCETGNRNFDVPDFGRQRELAACLDLLDLNHLETNNSPAWNAAAKLLSIGEANSIEYFFGDWRRLSWHESGRILDEKQTRKKLEWLAEIRRATCLCLLGDKLDSFRRIASYVASDLGADDAYGTRRIEDTQFWKMFYTFVSRRKPPHANSKRAILSSRCRRAKLLLTCLENLVAGDGLKLAASVEKLLDHYATKEFDSNLPEPCVDATVLHLTAKHFFELDMPEIDPGLMDHVLTQESVRMNRL